MANPDGSVTYKGVTYGAEYVKKYGTPTAPSPAPRKAIILTPISATGERGVSTAYDVSKGEDVPEVLGTVTTTTKPLPLETKTTESPTRLYGATGGVSGQIPISTTQQQQYGFSSAFADSNAFYDTRGYGYSIAPELAVTGVKSQPFGFSEVSYEGGKKQLVYTGNIDVYGTPIPVESSIFEPPSLKKSFLKARSDVITGVDKFLFTPTKIGENYETVLNPAGEFTGLYNLALKINPYLRGTENSATFAQTKVGGIGVESVNYMRQNPDIVLATYGGGYLLSRGIASIPPITRFLANPKVSYGLAGLYATGVGTEILFNPTEYKKILGREAVTLGASIYGFKAGARAGGYNYPIFDKKSVTWKPVSALFTPKATRVEAVTSLTESKSFGKNIYSEKYGMLSELSKSQGGGLYKVGDKYYKLTYLESGKGIDVSEGSSYLKSAGKIRIQEFGYNINVGKERFIQSADELLGVKYKPPIAEYRAKVGRPRMVNFESVGFTRGTLGAQDISLVTKYIPRGNKIFYRYTAGKIVPRETGYDYGFLGESVDTTSKYIIPKSSSVVKGESYLLFRDAPKTTIFGDVFEKSVTKSVVVSVGKTTFNKNLLQDIGSIKKSYGRISYIESANNLLGLSNVQKSSTAVLSGNLPVAQLTLTKPKVSTTGVIVPLLAKKQTQKTQTQLVAPKRTIKTYSQYPPIVQTYQVPILETNVVPKLSITPTLDLKQVTQPKSQSRQISSPITRPVQTQTPQVVPKQEVLPKQIVIPKQTTRLNLFRPLVIPKINYPRFSFAGSAGFNMPSISMKGISKYKKARKSEIYVLPDLRSVSVTEARNFFKFGGGEARTPRLRGKTKLLALKAFKGLSSGFIPTRELQKSMRL